LIRVKCTQCDADIPVPDDVMQGELLSCPDCSTDYEVVKVGHEGVVIKEAEAVAEDWGE